MHARVDDHLRARATPLPIRLGASAGPPRVVYHPCQSLTLGVLQTRHPAAPRAGAEGFDLCEAMACIAMRTSPFPSRLGSALFARPCVRRACRAGAVVEHGEQPVLDGAPVLTGPLSLSCGSDGLHRDRERGEDVARARRARQDAGRRHWRDHRHQRRRHHPLPARGLSISATQFNSSFIWVKFFSAPALTSLCRNPSFST